MSFWVGSAAVSGGRHRAGALRTGVGRFRSLLLLFVVGIVATLSAPPAFAGSGPNGDRGHGHAVGADWLGSYSYGDMTDVYCLDAGHAAPGDSGGTTFTEQTVNWPAANYILNRWNESPSNDRASALKFVFDRLLPTEGSWVRDPKPGHENAYQSIYDANQWSVKSNATAMLEAAEKFAGPYSLSVATVAAPSETSGTGTLRFTLKSAAGYPMTNKNVAFSAVGAASGLSASSGTTNSAGEVTVSFQIANGQTGGVKAVGSPGYGTKVTVFMPEGATQSKAGTKGFQRFVGDPDRSTVSASRQLHRDEIPRGKVSVVKTDGATGAGLAGAEFDVRKGSATGAVVGRIVSSGAGAATSGVLSDVRVGDTVWIVETKAPAGFILHAPVTAVVTADGSGAARISVPNGRASDRAMVKKTDVLTGAALSHVTFTAQVRKVGSSSWVNVTGGAMLGVTTEPTPGNYVTGTAGVASIDGKFSSPRLVFGDSVRFTEVAAAPGYKLPPAGERTVSGTVGTDGVLELTATNTPYRPSLVTSARNAVNGLGSLVESGGTVVDTVSFSDLEPGSTYRVFGELMLKRDGVAVPTGITGSSDPFTPAGVSGDPGAAGTVDVSFALPDPLPAEWGGQDLVVFETLKRGSVTVAEHTDIADVEQTVHVTDLRTSATSSAEAFGSLVKPGTRLVDTVAFTNLVPGVEYELAGEFHAVIDGAAVPTGVTGSTTFTPAASDGTVEVLFDVPADLADSLRGVSWVAFETLYRNGHELVVHADITDVAQTVWVPEVTTTAGNSDVELGKVALSGQTVVDLVQVCGVEPGVRLFVDGSAYAFDADGVAYDVELHGSSLVTFPDDEPCATFPIDFEVGADVLAGTTLVFRQDVYLVPDGAGDEWVPAADDVPVASHDDPSDVAQTVWVPGLGTTAGNAEADLGRTVVAGGQLRDLVAYSGLEPGVEYEVSGEFHAVIDGEPVPTSVTGSTTFTPAASDGTVEVLFDVPADLAAELRGVSWVAFETLYRAGHELVVHADVTDEAQTVWVPEVGTTAGNAEADLGRTVVAGGQLLDTVAYSGLEPGVEYEVSGEFHAVIDGEPVPTGVAGSTAFTPAASDGTVEVLFDVPADLAAELRGVSWVAFETLYRAGHELVVHADVTDVAQTVWVPEITSTVLVGPAGEGGPDVRVDSTAGAQLVDTVAYAGVEPGAEYVLFGELMAADGSGSTGITGSATFTPTSSSGTVEVLFDVPAGFVGAGSELIVAFETLERASAPGVAVAVHHDLLAALQQITVTGSDSGVAVAGVTDVFIESGLGAESRAGSWPLVAAGGLLVLLAGAGVVWRRRAHR